MNSKKLWQAFLLIFVYTVGGAFLACAFTSLFSSLNAKWGVPFAVGIGLWAVSLVFFLLREKARKFSYAAFAVNALSCGLLIASFAVGKHIGLSFAVLPVFAAIIAGSYLVFMAFLTPPKLVGKIWYVALAYIVFMALAVFAGMWLCRAYCRLTGRELPQESGIFFLFFYLILGFLSLGTLVSASNFGELLTAMIAPALCVTCFVGIIVLIALACGEGGDCDCGDGCCDCCDCSGGDFGGTHYRKKNGTTMSELSRN